MCSSLKHLLGSLLEISGSLFIQLLKPRLRLPYLLSVLVAVGGHALVITILIIIEHLLRISLLVLLQLVNVEF